MNLRNPQVRVHLDDELIVDLFAGGGGTSTGIEAALGVSPDIAANHDPEAVAMHMVNHPSTKHYCEDVVDLDIAKICAGRPVGILWLSPDCTYHSKARGGKPFRDRNKARRRRGLANVAIKWAKVLPPSQRPRVIALENVEEFEDWGPLADDGLPCKLRRGLSFRRWVKQLENLGYVVEWRQMRASDYGAPTIRNRLFLVARCDGEPIIWPAPTHGDPSKPGFKESGLKVWRTAAECIDWNIPCPSIFERKKPLVENTLRRIAVGVKRYVIDAAKPFIIPVTHAGDNRAHSVDAPLRTITTAKRGEFALIAPHLVGVGGRAGQSRPRGADEPTATLTTKGDTALIAPTLIQTGYGERDGQAPRVPGLDKPLGTIVAGGGKHAVVAAFLNKHFSGAVGSAMTAPVATITPHDHNSVTAAHLTNFYTSNTGGGEGDLTKPARTITAGGQHQALVYAFLMKYYGEGGQWQSATEPMHTIPTKDRMALVSVSGLQYCISDIGMRMLTARERYRANGFPENYKIDVIYKGKVLTQEAQGRMVGNSVPPQLAQAIVGANFKFRRMEKAA